MVDPDQFTPPKSDKGDVAHTLAKAAVSAVPYIGGPAAELFNLVIVSPLEKRRQAWMEKIADALRLLESRQGLNLEELQTNDTFVNVLIQASSIAMRNHQNEKIEALKNAVVNSALGIDMREEFQVPFIRYIDELVPPHLLLLKYLYDHEQSISHSDSYEQLYIDFDKEYPNFLSRDEFKMLLGDLTTRGLIRISSDIDDFEDLYVANNILVDESTPKDLPKLIVTSIGKDFLAFIGA